MLFVLVRVDRNRTRSTRSLAGTPCKTAGSRTRRELGKKIRMLRVGALLIRACSRPLSSRIGVGLPALADVNRASAMHRRDKSGRTPATAIDRKRRAPVLMGGK